MSISRFPALLDQPLPVLAEKLARLDESQARRRSFRVNWVLFYTPP